MPTETIEKLSFLALGWLLGLLGPIIVDSIRRRRENALGRRAMLSELKELSCILAIAAYAIRMKQGTLDREFLRWAQDHLDNSATTEQMKKFALGLKEHISLSDNQLAMLLPHMVSKGGTGAVLQKYPVPLLDARVSALWSFDTAFQRCLLEIRQNLHLLDDLVDRSRKYQDLTFAKHEEENYRLIVENLDQCRDLYAERAQKVADLIRALAT